MSRDLTLATMTFLRSNLKPEARVRYLENRAHYYHHAALPDLDMRNKQVRAHVTYAQKQFSLSRDLFIEFLDHYKNKEIAIKRMIQNDLIPPQFTGYTRCSKCFYAPSRDICEEASAVCDFCKR